MRILSASLLLGLVLSACGSSEDGDDLESRLVRERVAALYEEDSLQAALDALRPLLETDRARPRDFLDAAVLELQLGNLEAARARAERALENLPDDPAAHFVLGRALKDLGELEAARDRLRRAHELAPDDVPSELALASVLDDLGEAEDAIRHYRSVLAADRGEWGNWQVSAAYRLGRLHLQSGDDAAYEAVRAIETELRDVGGFDAPDNKTQLTGELGKLVFPAPAGTRPAGAPEVAPTAVSAAAPAELAGFEHVAVVTLGAEWREPERDDMGNVVAPAAIERPDLLGWGAAGVRVAHAAGEGGWEVQTLSEEPVEGLWPIDWNDDGWLDFALLSGGVLRLREWDPEARALTGGPEALPLPSPPRDARAVDYDHDGDADLLLVGDFGARIWRNDGLTRGSGGSQEDPPPGEGAFTDATAEAQLPTDAAFTWCVIEDFDVDQDVDFLLGSASAAWLGDSLRGGVFADRTADVGDRARSDAPPIVADLDGDELPDLWFGGRGTVLFGTREGPFRREAALAGASELASRAFLDLDLDGAGDALGLADGALRAAWAIGLPVASAVKLDDVPGALAAGWGDVDADGRLEALVSGPDAAEQRRFGAPLGRHGFRLALLGDKDNRRGLGATVEVRAREVYRRIYWGGEPQLVGLGDAPAADIVRVTWPNGVVQNVFDVAPGKDVVVRQVERVAGSCPFLYTWNGEEYTFVSDVLGITPLGLPMAPGMLVPPDHDEYVLITGDQLRPRTDADGTWYDLQLTEELREVTYLDQARLLVVDHPADTELYPNELFCFPPFPERHEHVLEELHAPERAPGSDGRDWSAELAALDGRYASPFSGYRDQFQGLAPPWTLELAFDPDSVPEGERLRLVCTGWLLWGNASVNMAAARTPGIEFLPPVLQVPDPGSEGGWRSTGPPVGFPAGKTKSMVIDVTDLVDREDPRLRLLSTLCIHWDSIRLAVGDDGPTSITTLEPAVADLWDRGFSEVIHPADGYKLEWFVWDRLSADPLWNQHPGLYTRYGDSLPLVDAIDDRFVVLGAGDALHLRFDASGVPPLRDGWRRDYLLFLDGWAKDRDPNTLEALEVEPFPFHGMSGYPYGPDESFPDTEAHRRWREEWLTRPAKRWIEPLAPGA